MFCLFAVSYIAFTPLFQNMFPSSTNAVRSVPVLCGILTFRLLSMFGNTTETCRAISFPETLLCLQPVEHLSLIFRTTNSPVGLKH